MAEIKTTRRWNGLLVDQYTDTSTGQIEIRTAEAIIGTGIKGDLLAISNGRFWKIVDQKGFVKRYNNAQINSGKPTVTDAEFVAIFNKEGIKDFNNDRAAVLNNPDNYATPELAEGNRAGFVQRNIPLVRDPRTNLMVSSAGVQQTIPSQATQQTADPDADKVVPGTGNNTAEGREAAAEAAGQERGGGKGKTYRYPLEKPGGPFEYDYISITARDYVASGLGVGSDDYYRVDKNLGTRYETVIFPMQPQLSETNAVNWSDDQLNPVQAAFGKAAFNVISQKDFLSKGLDAIKNAFGDLTATANSFLQDPLTRKAVAAYFAGQAVGANLQGRLTGNVINPNLELLFNGPQLRIFNFNFRLTPRTQEESDEIRKIIFAFKRNMAAQRSSTGLFLRSPRLFELKYIFKEGTQHPYLNKFKPCAMTNFAVNYTPDGSYATFETGSLTAYDLNMSFSEIMPIYSNDNEYTENPQDMGF